MNVIVRHRLGRVLELFTSFDYRHLLKQRLLTWLVRKINPNVIYLGVKGNGEDMLLHCHDKAVTPYTLATGNFQKDDIEKICKILESEGRNLDGCFFDIGGNIGSTSIYAAATKRFSHVYCFEPVPDNVRLAKANISLNDLENEITLIPKAVSDHEGTIEMVLSKQNCGDHRIASSDKNQGIKNAQAAGNFTENIQVETTTIDQFVLDHLGSDPVSVIWSDTQGFEGIVLKGGLDLIKKTKVPLCIEFWPYGLRNADCLEGLAEILKGNYQSYFDLNEANPRKRSISELSATIDQYNTEFLHTDLLLI